MRLCAHTDFRQYNNLRKNRVEHFLDDDFIGVIKCALARSDYQHIKILTTPQSFMVKKN